MNVEESSGTGRVAVSLEPRADQVRLARQRIATVCSGMSSERVHAVKLLVSELVTSAIRHHPRRLRVEARKVPQQVRVDVREEGPTSATVADAPLEQRHAGTMLLTRLASTWGVKWAGDGKRKTVWFTLDGR